jgi:hypothetical protein
MTLSTKIKLYANKEIDFLTDVLLQDDGNGAYIKEWNLDIPKPTMAQLDAFEAQATTYENNEKLKQLEKLYMEHGTSSLKKFTIMV